MEKYFCVGCMFLYKGTKEQWADFFGNRGVPKEMIDKELDGMLYLVCGDGDGYCDLPLPDRGKN